jgi:serralysin
MCFACENSARSVYGVIPSNTSGMLDGGIMDGPITGKTYAEAGLHITRDNQRWGDNANMGQPAVVTFGFRPASQTPIVPFPPPENQQEFTAAQKDRAQLALGLWADIANLTFSFANPGTGPFPDNPDIYFGAYSEDDNRSGFAYLPDLPSGGDTWINLRNADITFSPGSNTFRVLIHEIGHSLGLNHPGNYNGSGTSYENNAEYFQDTRQFSVMSYFEESSWSSPDASEPNNASWATANHYGIYASTPLLHDIAAIQRLYGANATVRSGNSTYGFNSTEGSAYTIADSTNANRRVFCIYDTGGIDTLDASGYSVEQKIYLEAATATMPSQNVKFSSIGGLVKNISIAPGSVIENARGGSGKDTIWGNAANNIIVGGAGADIMSGGAGDDTYYVDNVADVVDDALMNGGQVSSGYDTIYTSVSFTADAQIERIIATGTSSINLTGSGLLIGNAGNNFLYGGNESRGGLGNDVYFDPVNAIELAAEGTDAVFSNSQSFTLGANIENLLSLRLPTISRNFSGNSLDNMIETGAGNDILNGFGGNDQLFGYDGNDVLDGGTGSDILDGGQGLDTADYYYSAVGIRIVLTTWRFASSGPFQFENIGVGGGAFGDSFISIENFEGSQLNDTIVGDEFNNVIRGGYGFDKLAGGAGNDVLWGNGTTGGDYADNGGSGANFDSIDWLEGGPGNDTYWTLGTNDLISEAANEGIDLVIFVGMTPLNQTSSSYSLEFLANVENLTYGGVMPFTRAIDPFLGDRPTTGNFEGTGNSLGNTIRGWTFIDTLRGLGGNDVPFGGDGDDKLVGGAGDDIMYGGLGNDIYYVEDAFDVVDEQGSNSAYDYIFAYVSTTSSAGIERVYLKGLGNLSATGRDGQNDYLEGNESANVLRGLGGNDLLIGGNGNDTYTGGAGADVFRLNGVLSSSANRDVVTDFNVADDAFQLENLTMSRLSATGWLSAAQFKELGPGVQDADDVILYIRSSGAIYYDANGTVAGGVTHIASVTAGLALTAADFYVV